MFHRHTSLSAFRAFEAAARLHSFKLAAEELNLSATAISHQVRNLESKLGTQLFIRGTRQVTLTPQGEQLASAAHAALLQLSDAIEDITDAATTLSVCVPESFAALWLVPQLADFNRAQPDIRIEIKSGDYCPDIHNDLRVDFGIRYSTDNNHYEHETLLAEERLGLYAAPEYFENNVKEQFKKTANNTSKQAEIVIAQTQAHAGLPLFNQLPVDSDNLNQTELEQTLLTTAKYQMVEKEHHALQLALTGQAIARLNYSFADYYIQRGLLLPLLSEPVKTGGNYRLYIPPQNSHLKKVRLFHQWLVSFFSATQ